MRDHHVCIHCKLHQLALVCSLSAAALVVTGCGGGGNSDETQWTDTLRLHEVIQTSVSPVAALSLGLKVDAEALPAALVRAIQNGDVDLNSPATTVALLKLNAVVGLQGKVETINDKGSFLLPTG